MNFACLVKERSIDKRSAAKFECADLSPFDCNQRGNGFITRIQKPLRYGLESDASRRKLDPSIFAFAEEVNFGEILKLVGPCRFNIGREAEEFPQPRD